MIVYYPVINFHLFIRKIYTLTNKKIYKKNTGHDLFLFTSEDFHSVNMETIN